MTDPPDPLLDRLAGFRAGLAGRYEIVRQVGEGGMAVVLLARDLQHDRPVALKVLHPELTRSLGGERFHQEIRLTARVQHPHIVAIYDSGETDGHLWYSMPFIEGESLRQRLAREEQLPVPEAIRIIREVALALAAAHQAGIVHRDIKPENILLTPAGDVYLVDFGVARGIDSASLTRTGLAVGTPQYMSPEQASGTTEVGPRSDVYTLGCVLYEMLAGDPPFTGRTPQAVSARHLHSPVPDVRIVRETVSPALQQVLRTALAKTPADRYADAGALAAALERAQASPEPKAWSRLARYGGIVLGVLAIAVALRWSWAHRPPPVPGKKGPPTIAVLYFENADRDSSLDAIADGMTEELIRELTGASNAYRVVSKFGVLPYKNGKTPVDSMRARLGADYWVSGDIARVDGHIRVRGQLIDAHSNIVVDSLSTPASGSNPRELAGNAALALAALLRKKLGIEVNLGATADTSTSALANSLELEGERYRREAEYFKSLPDARNVSDAMVALARADSLFERAGREDTTWLKPLISRCWVAIERGKLELGPGRAVWLREGLKLADQAVRRAPDDASALEARGTIRYELLVGLNADDSAGYHQAELDLRDAVGRDSLRASAWAKLGELLMVTGKLEESDLASTTALRVDPFLSNAAAVKNQLFYVNLFLPRFDQAEGWCRHMRAEHPDDWFSRQCELTLIIYDNRRPPDPAEAWRIVAVLDSLDPVDKARAAGHPYTPVYRRLLAAMAEARAGNTSRAEAELAWARHAAAGDSIMQLDMAPEEAYLLFALGRREEARRRMNAFNAVRPTQIAAMEREPLYRDLMGLPTRRPSTAPR